MCKDAASHAMNCKFRPVSCACAAPFGGFDLAKCTSAVCVGSQQYLFCKTNLFYLSLRESQSDLLCSRQLKFINIVWGHALVDLLDSKFCILGAVRFGVHACGRFRLAARKGSGEPGHTAESAMASHTRFQRTLSAIPD